MGEIMKKDQIINILTRQLGRKPTLEEIYFLCDKPSILSKHIKDRNYLEKQIKLLMDEHNHSLRQELYLRNKDNLNLTAIKYRGNKISFGEMFENSDRFYSSLAKIGLKKGDEIAVCIDNTPELIYLLLAASDLGIILNFFGDKFDKDFIKQIIDGCSQKLFICADNFYGNIKDIVDEFPFENKVLISLTDSLPLNENGEKYDPYAQIDDMFLKFENKALKYKHDNSDIKLYEEFINFGYDYVVNEKPEITLDDDFTITYTSGSTKIGYPKQINHKVINYISLARFHDSDLSGLPEMRNMSSLALAPTHSNTQLTANITDVLSQKCTVDLEPIYRDDFFIYSLLINQSSFASATTSYWIKAAKMCYTIPELKNIKLENLQIPTASGERASEGEEKFLNKFFKKVKAGTAVLPFPLSPVTLSIGGGDTEHGGIFFTLFKELKSRISFTKEYGLDVFPLAEIAVLDENGKELDFNQWGNLVATSISMMNGYKNNPEANSKFFIYDYYGRKWGNCNLGAKINKKGQVIVGGRLGNEILLSNGTKYAEFEISNIVTLDSKNILSSETAFLFDNQYDRTKGKIVIHIEKQPSSTKSIENILISVNNRLKREFPNELIENIIYRVRDYMEGFPLTKSGKRSVRDLELEGLSNPDKCYIVCEDQVIRYDDVPAKILQLNNKIKRP